MESVGEIVDAKRAGAIVVQMESNAPRQPLRSPSFREVRTMLVIPDVREGHL